MSKVTLVTHSRLPAELVMKVADGVAVVLITAVSKPAVTFVI